MWNARGAADIAKIEHELSTMDRPGGCSCRQSDDHAGADDRDLVRFGLCPVRLARHTRAGGPHERLVGAGVGPLGITGNVGIHGARKMRSRVCSPTSSQEHVSAP